MSRARPTVALALSCAAVTLCASTAHAQKAEVSLSANRTSVSVGEQFVLEARVDIEDGDFERVELPDLGDFQVLGHRQSRPYSFSFSFGGGGSSRSSVVHTYSLRALAPGKVELAPVKAVVSGKTFRSKGLTLEVTGSASNAVPSPPSPTAAATDATTATDDAKSIRQDQVDPVAFLHAAIDTTEARVGEQVTVSFYLYTRRTLSSSPHTTQEPSTEGFWTHSLMPDSLSATIQSVNGRQYRVYLLNRIAAFPLTAGKHRIGAMTIEMGGGNSIFDMLAGSREKLTRSTQPIEIEVAPLPDSVDVDAPWHVGTLELDWSAEPARAAVGDAVTLRATVKGTGNLRGLRLPDPQVPGFEVLEPTVSDEVTDAAGIVGGSRTYEWLALARQPGEHIAPSPAVQVVDPQSGEVSQAKGAPLTLVVEGRAASAAAPGAAPSAEPGDDAQASAEGDGLDLGRPRGRARLEPPAPPLIRRAWYWPSLCLLPLLALSLFGFRLWKRALAARLEARDDLRLASAAEGALAEAERSETPGPERLRLLRKAVLLGVERATGENAEAWTYDALEARLAALPSGSKELAKEVAALLRELEAARFMPGNETQVARDTSGRAAGAVKRLRAIAHDGSEG